MRGLIGLLSAVGAYYLLIALSEAGFRLIGAPHAATTWGAVGVIAGPIFGAAGGAWRHWQGTGRALAVAVLAASLIAEGIVFGRLRFGDIGVTLLLIEVGIGLVVPFALLRRGERLIGYVATGSWPWRSGWQSSRSSSSSGPSPTGSRRGATGHGAPSALRRRDAWLFYRAS